jgi:hypothetical protein
MGFLLCGYLITHILEMMNMPVAKVPLSHFFRAVTITENIE